MAPNSFKTVSQLPAYCHMLMHVFLVLIKCEFVIVLKNEGCVQDIMCCDLWHFDFVLTYSDVRKY